MADASNISVKLTLDNAEYVAAMRDAINLTHEFYEALKATGLSDADMPSAMRGVIKIVANKAGTRLYKGSDIGAIADKLTARATA